MANLSCPLFQPTRALPLWQGWIMCYVKLSSSPEGPLIIYRQLPLLTGRLWSVAEWKRQVFLIWVKNEKTTLIWKGWKKETSKAIGTQEEKGNKTSLHPHDCSLLPSHTVTAHAHFSLLCSYLSCSPHWLCSPPSVKFPLPIQFQIELPPTFSYSNPEEMENSWSPSSLW